MEHPTIRIPDLIGRAPGGRKLIAVVSFDMVGYSRLIGLDDIGTLERLQALRRNLIDPAIEEHGGSIIQTAGDSLLIVFDSIDGAVRCAVNIQRQIPSHDRDHHPGRPIRFRVGINLGDVIADGTDLHGDSVNVAARLQAECPPGSILVTRAIRDHVHDRLDLVFEELGAMSLKNIARSIEAFLLRLEPGSADQIPLPTALAGQPSSKPAKLPRLSVMMTLLKNQGVPKELEYLVEAITEDISTDLSHYLGYSTVIGAPETVIKPREVAREVGYLVQGSIGGTSNRLRLTLHLINLETGDHLLRERFTIDLCGSEARSEISSQAAWILFMKLHEDINRHLTGRPPQDLIAEEWVMRGRALILRPWTADIHHRTDHQEAARCFEQALRMDPASTNAKLGVAALLILNITDGWSMPGGPDEARAEQLLADILRVDANMPIMHPYAHTFMGSLRRIQGRWQDSYVECMLAVELAPNHPPFVANLGMTLAFLNQPEVAVPKIEKILRLTPPDNYAPLYHVMLGLCHLLLENIDRAIVSLRTARAVNPSIFYIHVWLAAALGLKGELNEAVAALRVASEMRPNLLSPATFFLLRGTSAEFVDRYERTIYLGLRRASLHTNDIDCPEFGVIRSMLANT